MSRRPRNRIHTALKYWLILLILSGVSAQDSLRAEIIFRDSLSGPAGSVTNSVPALDIEGSGWQIAASSAPPQLDGQGHLFDPSTTAGGPATVPLIPNGPYGSMTLAATVNLAKGTQDWVGLGFDSQVGFLTDATAPNGPWIKISATGSITLFGGAGQSNSLTVPAAFNNAGAPVNFLLTYDAFVGAATVCIVSNAVTNTLLSSIPITNTFATITPRYAAFQFPLGASAPQQRWISGISVDWLPRPRPLLQLSPVPTNVIMVGAPTGGSDITLIQNALNAAAAAAGGAEVRFNPGATYIISNNVQAGQVPLSLSHATNVLVNGNGCQILVKNPFIGFIEAAFSANVIFQRFTVDYDPLPFTQGVVTSNLAPAQAAFLFKVDPGYPAPTNANYLDIANWGTFMDPTRPGRLADGHSSIYEFSAVTATSTSNIFKVTLNNLSKAKAVAVGDIWCQLARYNGSTLFRARFSSNVTFLNLTMFTGAAAAFAGSSSSLVNEIGCQVLIGPSPGGTNGVPRRKTTNADGGIFTNPRIGPWVERNSFTGMSDDVANANTLPFFVVGPVSKCTNTLYLQGFDPGGAIVDLVAGQMAVGDDITFYDGTNGAVIDRATVTAIAPPRVTFDHSICGIFPGSTTTNTCIFDNSLNTSAVYLSNQFSNSRIHGIYCRANNILIAHNFITGMGFSAVAAQPDLSLAGPNSAWPTNAVIIDNVFQDGGFSWEATNNTDPGTEPVWALVELHKAIASTDYIPTGTEISGVRILNNAFLQWRRGAIALHNVADCQINHNYFGPPATNTPGQLLIDLWASDYPTVTIANNVEPAALTPGNAISEDSSYTTFAGAFIPLTGPVLNAVQSPGALSITWTNPVPGFVLQQTASLGSSWVDSTNLPWITAGSNMVNIQIPPAVPALYFRARQR